MKLKTQLSHIYHTFETQLTAEDKYNYNELTHELLPLDAGFQLKHRTESTGNSAVEWTTPADLLIARMITDSPQDMVTSYRLPDKRGNKSMVNVSARRRGKRPMVTTESTVDELEVMRQKLTTREWISDELTRRNVCPSQPLSGNIKSEPLESQTDDSVSFEWTTAADQSIGDSIVKKVKRRPKGVSDCTPEELEILRQKFVNREGIWDELTGHYVCPKSDCKAAYEQINDLYRHMRSVHRLPSSGPEFQKRIDSHTNEYFDVDTNCYVCTEGDCRERIQKQFAFYRHLINAHNKVPDIVCDVCGKAFKRTGDLTTHQRLHADPLKAHHCPLEGCDYRCRNKQLLEQHMVGHSDARPYQCDHVDCDKRFKTASNLRVHSETHIADFQIKCYIDGCDLWFKNRWIRKRHVHLAHKGLTPEALKQSRKSWPCDWPGCEFAGSNAALIMHKRVHTGERPFACDWPECGKRFRLKAHLNDHKNIHINFKPLMCHWPGCGYRCNDSGNLRKHIRTKHK
ncbi:unnamed protein product [Medioppia subpectinata]|uniref:C2H2-type domain-containing protein n=1 Tax=Medioppia subpectinata TaxID=1979941 RepID=A0A7R9PVG7_9ACAR|nr:unnamed protein product [Medioppia subpectinata]CAG2102278.1 unnamed protein product [Medioppia subpectinata]